MSDNLKQLKENLDVAIDPNKGVGEILAEQHNDVFTEFINKQGKYVGFPFSAVSEGTNGEFPTGTFSWNGNTMNDTNNFIITLGVRTLDINPITPIVDGLNEDDVIHFKDFVGRSVFLNYVSHSYSTDVNGSPIVNITVKGIADNINYAYQPGEIEPCVITFYKNAIESNVYDIQLNGNNFVLLENGNPKTTIDLSIAITETIVSAEDTLAGFVANNGNYTYQQGDVISIVTSPDSILELYLFKGGDKSDVANYLKIDASKIDWVNILNKPLNLSDFVDDIGATDPIVPNTIFVDTINGSDVDGVIQNRNQPFQTDTAAYAAIPNDGSVWEINFIDGNVSRNLNEPFPDKKFKIVSESTGNFIFTNNPSPHQANNDVEVYVPNATFTNSGGTASQFGTSASYSTKITCKTLNSTRTASGFGGTITGNSLSFVKVLGDATVGTRTIGFSGTFEVQGTLNFGGESIGGNSANNIIYDFNILNLTASASICEQNTSNLTFNVKEITSTGVFTLTFLKTYKPNTTINFDNTKISNDVSLVVTSNINTAINVTLQINGTLLNKGLTFNTRPVIAHTNFNIIFNNFTGKIDKLQIACEADITFINSNIDVSSNLVNVLTHPSPIIKNMVFIGSNVITQTSSSALMVGVTTLSTIIVKGTVSTNAPTFGINIDVDYQTATFKEKLGEIVIRNKIDIINRVLDLDKTYIIDGEIILLAGEYIEVPAGGNLTINGYGLEASAITKNVVGESIFSSPVGGSSGLQMQGLSISSGAGSVFDLVDVDGTNAIETNVCNFTGCASLGEIDGYRQFLGTTIGIYGCSDGLTLSGTWNGFKITNTNAFGFGATGTLFKEGTALLFNNRFYAELNLDFPTGSEVSDFQASNFNDNELFQVTNSIFKLNSSLDAETNTPLLFPNLDGSDINSRWINNIGIINTQKYLRANVTTEVETVISAVDTYTPLLGTFTLTDDSHFDMPANGEFRLLSGAGFYKVFADFTIVGTANNVIDLRVTKSTDDGVTFPTEVNHIQRQINSLVSTRDVAFFPISFIVFLNKNDRVRFEVENKTSSDNVTAELDGYVTINE